MKPLTERQARNCEEAKLPRCRCRCGGKLHGAKRGGDNPERSFYEELPPEDPHFVPPKEERDEFVWLPETEVTT